MQKLIAIVLAISLLVAMTSKKMPAGAELAANVFASVDSDQHPVSTYSGLLLNNRALDYANFSINSQGKLALVAANPASENVTKMPFRIYLQRNGILIQQDASDESRQVEEVDVATVLRLARPGDELIIEPVLKADWLTRRVIRLRSPMPMDWLLLKPGC